VAYRLVIFDFDGTLANSAPWMTGAIMRAAEKFGFRKPERAELLSLRDRDSRVVFRTLGIQVWRLPQIAEFIRDLAIAEANPPLFDGIADMLRALHRAGVKLAVVSSNSEIVVRRALGPELCGLMAAFDCDASIFGKAAKFRRVVQKLGAHRSAVIAIGDEGRDIEASRAAKIACGAVSWGYATPGLLKSLKPDRFFAAPVDIAALMTPSV
jgi:phosphoglycolate phosphatase